MPSVHMHAPINYSAFSVQIILHLQEWTNHYHHHCWKVTKWVSLFQNKISQISNHHSFLYLFLQKQKQSDKITLFINLSWSWSSRSSCESSKASFAHFTKKRFYPLQGCWNHIISKLSGQGRQHEKSNKLPSRKSHPLCHWQQLQPYHFLKDMQMKDCEWLPWCWLLA